MGRIKTKLIKRTAQKLVESESLEFSDDFEKNKKILADSLPSKKMRNMVAGYITRLKKKMLNQQLNKWQTK